MKRNSINLTNKNMSNNLNIKLIPNNRILNIDHNGVYCAYSKDYSLTHNYNDSKYFKDVPFGICSDQKNLKIYDEKPQIPLIILANISTSPLDETMDATMEEYYLGYKDKLVENILLNDRTANNEYYGIKLDDIKTYETQGELIIPMKKEGDLTIGGYFPFLFLVAYTKIFVKIPFNKDSSRPFERINPSTKIRFVADFDYSVGRFSRKDNTNEILSGDTFYAETNGSKQITGYIDKSFVDHKFSPERAILSDLNKYIEFEYYPKNYLDYSSTDDYSVMSTFDFYACPYAGNSYFNKDNDLIVEIFLPLQLRSRDFLGHSFTDSENNVEISASLHCAITLKSLGLQLIGPSYKKTPNNYLYTWVPEEYKNDSKVLTISNPFINNMNFYGVNNEQSFIPITNLLANQLSNNFLSNYFFGRQYGSVNTFYSEIKSINGERVMNGVSGKIPKLNDIVYFNDYLPNEPFIITKCEVDPCFGTILLEFTKMAKYDNPSFEQELDNNVVFATNDEDIIESKEIGDFYINRIGNNTYNIIDISEIIDAIETPSASNYAKDENNLLEYDGYYWHYVEAKYYSGEEWINTSISANKLTTPIVSLSGNNITWGVIDNANEYFIYSNGELIGRTNNLYYNISSIDGLNYINVKAMSKSYSYFNSDFSNTIEVDNEWVDPSVSDGELTIKQAYTITKDDSNLTIE